MNQISAQGYVSRASHIIAFGYVAPIIAFSNCFLANGVMKSGVVHKEWHQTEILGSFDKCKDIYFCLEVFRQSRDNRPQNICVSSDELSSFFLFP